MWNLRESMETEAELHKKRCPLLNACVYCQSSWSWEYSVLGGDTVVVVETGEGWQKCITLAKAQVGFSPLMTRKMTSLLILQWTYLPQFSHISEDKSTNPIIIVTSLPDQVLPTELSLPCQHPQLTASFILLTPSLIPLPLMNWETTGFGVNTSSFAIHAYYTIISSHCLISSPISKSFTTF